VRGMRMSLAEGSMLAGSTLVVGCTATCTAADMVHMVGSTEADKGYTARTLVRRQEHMVHTVVGSTVRMARKDHKDHMARMAVGNMVVGT